MPTYRVSFQDGLIGSSPDHGPVLVRAGDLGDLAEAIYDITAQTLHSARPEVVIDHQEDDLAPVGLIYTGADTIARFAVEELPA